jgi:hypothetical protein
LRILADLDPSGVQSRSQLAEGLSSLRRGL